MKGKSGSLFNNWIKNFATTVFTQTFHAFFLVFILRFLSGIQNADVPNGTEGMVAIMAIVTMMALIKFEKLIKTLFGVEDGMIGDLKTSGAQMFGATKAVGSIGKSLYDPFKKHGDAKRKVDRLGNELKGKVNAVDDKGNNLGAFSDRNIRNNFIDTRNIKDEAMLNGINSDGSIATSSGNSQFVGPPAPNNNNNNNNNGNGNGNSSLNQETNNLLRQLIQTTAANGGSGDGSTSGASGNSIAAKAEQYNDALRDMKVASRDRWLNTASVIGGASIGAGMYDQASEIAMAGAVISKPFAVASTKMATNQENVKAREATGDSKYEGKLISESIKEGFKKAKTGASNVSNDIRSNPSNLGKMTVNAIVNTAGYQIKKPYEAVTGRSMNFKTKRNASVEDTE